MPRYDNALDFTSCVSKMLRRRSRPHKEGISRVGLRSDDEFNSIDGSYIGTFIVNPYNIEYFITESFISHLQIDASWSVSSAVGIYITRVRQPVLILIIRCSTATTNSLRHCFIVVIEGPKDSRMCSSPMLCGVLLICHIRMFVCLYPLYYGWVTTGVCTRVHLLYCLTIHSLVHLSLAWLNGRVHTGLQQN